MTRPSTKMLIALVGAGLALAVALGAAATIPTAASPVLPGALLVLASIAALLLLFLAAAAQGRRERATLQKIVNRRADALGSAAEELASISKDLRADMAALENGLAETRAAQSRVIDAVKAEGNAARINFGAVTEELGSIRREQHDLPSAVESLQRAQSSIIATTELTRDELGEALERLTAQDAELAKIVRSAQSIHRLVEVEDSRGRKLLNLVRAEARERGESSAATTAELAAIRRDVDGLGRGVATTEKNSADAAAAVRRVHNFLRKDGSIQILLDRFIATERRTFGALETARLEIEDELRRTAEENDALRTMIATRMAEVERAATESGRAVGEIVSERLTELQAALEDRLRTAEALGAEQATAIREHLTRVEGGAADRVRYRDDELVARVDDLRRALEARLGEIEATGAGQLHDVLEKLDLLERVGGQSADRTAALLTGLETTQSGLSRLEAMQGDVLRGAESIISLVRDRHAIAEARDAMSSPDGGEVSSAVAILEALERTAEDLKQCVVATGRAGEAEMRRFGVLMGDRIQRHLKRETIENVRQIEALMQLLQRVDTTERRYPATGWWALAADSMLYLSDHILEKKPKRILEVGSGASTIWLGTFARRIGAEYVSLEHDGDYAAETREMLSDYGLEDTVELRHAPLVTTTVDGTDHTWYDRSAFEDIGDGFDLLIVDGPPEATGDMARYPAMPLLADRLSSRAVVVLDDVHREAEAESLRRWAEMFEDFEIVRTGLSRTGMMVRTPDS